MAAVRVVLRALLALWLLSKLRRLIQWVRAQTRKRAVLLKLPTPEPRRSGFRLLGSLSTMVPQDQPISDKLVQQNFLRLMTEITRSDELKDEGGLLLWVLNKKIPVQALASFFIYDIDMARQVLATKSLDDYVKGRSYRTSEPLIGHGVLSSSGPEWAPQRAVIERGFKPDVLASNVHRIAQTAREHCEVIAKRLQDGKQGFALVDVHEEMLKVTMDVLGRTAFSYDIASVTAPSTKEAPLYDAFDCIIHTLEARIRNPFKQMTRTWPLKENQRFNMSMAKLDSVVDSIISARIDEKKAQQESSGRAVDLLDVLLAGVNTEDAEDGQGPAQLSRKQLVDNIKTMLFAGHDTTGAALTWMLYVCATRPDVADRLRAEALEHLGSADGVRSPDIDKLERMPYLNACILELLRLYPSAAFTRVAKHEVQIGKHVIPPQVEILIFPYLIHRDSRNFEDPDTFKPERWLSDKAEQLTLQAQLAKETRTKAYLPFSLGKRNCVGRPLALLEIRIVLLNVLLDFDLALPPAKDLPDFKPWPAMSLTLNPQGIKLRYSTRMP